MSQEDAKFLRQEYTKLQQELDEAREKIELQKTKLIGYVVTTKV